MYELKKKFRHLSLKNSKKQTVVQQLSSKPAKKADAGIRCYFSQDISRAYRNTCSRDEKLTHGFAYQCYYCNKFFARPDKHKRHMEHCSGVPGIV